MQCTCAVLCYNMWHVWRYNIFPHYLINGTIVGEKVTDHEMCVLTVRTTSVWSICHSRKNSARCDKKCTLIFMKSTVYYRQILMKVEFSRWIFEKYPDIKFNENPSIGCQVFIRTDQNVDDCDGRSAQFCERVQKPVSHCYMGK